MEKYYMVKELQVKELGQSINLWGQLHVYSLSLCSYVPAAFPLFGVFIAAGNIYPICDVLILHLMLAERGMSVIDVADNQKYRSKVCLKTIEFVSS